MLPHAKTAGLLRQVEMREANRVFGWRSGIEFLHFNVGVYDSRGTERYCVLLQRVRQPGQIYKYA